MWATIVNLSEQFNIPPWQFHDECTGYWWHRINAYNDEIAKYNKVKNG